MNQSQVTKEGHFNRRPGMEATVGVNLPAGMGEKRKARRKDEPEFHSYYDLPVINKPVWESPDIPGYLFLGGMAGVSSVVAVSAQLTARPGLARAAKVGSAAAGGLSLVALVHDLGRRGRLLNMLRVFKVTSPMSVGSWLLAGFVPAAAVAALSDLTGALTPVGALASAGAAVLGPAVASYTAALISNTAVPAWHEGHRLMPFVFVSSAVSSAAGWGLAVAPGDETGVLRPLGSSAGLAEIALSKLMEEQMGMVGEAYHEGKAARYMRAAEVLTVVGAALSAWPGRARLRSRLAGACLLAGSAFTRFGIFEAGMVSSLDPKYTVVPQRQRLEARRAANGHGPLPGTAAPLTSRNGASS